MSENPPNPLLIPGALPRFDAFEAAHVVPAFRQLLPGLNAALDALEALEAPDFEQLNTGLELISERLEFAWGVVTHLSRVKNSDALRAAYDEVQRDVVEFDLRVRQSGPVFRAARALLERGSIEGARRRVLEILIRDAEHAGIGLEGEARARFNAIELELAELATRFRNNHMDSNAAWELVLTQAEEVEGLPDTALRLIAQDAARHGHPDATPERGPWRLTLAWNVFQQVLTHSPRRELREQLYRAARVRATEPGRDNRPIIERVLELRIEKSHLLGFSTFADLCLTARMASDVASVEALMDEIGQAARGIAFRDVEALKDFAREQGDPHADDLRPWDLMYWGEQLRRARYAFDSEELRRYFPLEAVLDGLFDLTRRIFGVRVVPADGQTSVWQEDVRFFHVLDDATAAPLASFFLDPFARPAEKLSGAWHSTCRSRSRYTADARSAQLPASYLICNQTPPTPGRPSLMTFNEVKTLFHEFGHGLHNMLTTVDEGFVSGGRNVEWDFIEVPSKFMENWCYHPATLRRISRHVDTGEPLPDALIERLRAARNFMSGYHVHMQIYLTALDMELHHRYTPGGGEHVTDVYRRVRDHFALVESIEDDHFLCGFAHIFAGAYAAGYYSYMWSDVLAADAFASFEAAGLEDDAALAAVGRRYRDTILGMGGGAHPSAIFAAFLGRPASTEAFLRHQGLR